MSKKKLNTEDMLTELSGSPFFSPPRPQVAEEKKPGTTRGETSQEPSEDKETSEPTIPTSQKAKVETKASTAVPVPQKRVRIRYSFEAFGDQVEKLQSMKADAEANSGYFSISRFIRDALDEKLDK